MILCPGTGWLLSAGHSSTSSLSFSCFLQADFVWFCLFWGCSPIASSFSLLWVNMLLEDGWLWAAFVPLRLSTKAVVSRKEHSWWPWANEIFPVIILIFCQQNNLQVGQCWVEFVGLLSDQAPPTQRGTLYLVLVTSSACPVWAPLMGGLQQVFPNGKCSH